MKQIYFEHFNQGGYTRYRIPCCVVTNQGTVLVCYECRHGGDWSAMDLVIRRSTDGGITWSERFYIAKGEGINVIHNGILFVDGDTIHLVYHKNYRELYYTKSNDDGLTWCEAKNISDAYTALREQYNWTVIAAGPGHGLITSKGRMIIPVWVASNKENITAHGPSVITTLYSDDHGEKWQCGEIIYSSPDFIDPNESVLAELADGTIMINCRHITQNGMRKIGFSPDGIKDWHGFYFEPQLTEPICAAGMTGDKNHIWFTHCDCPEGSRSNLMLHRTDDQGKTWKPILMLDAQGGYSDAFYDAKSGQLFVVAETGRSDPNDPSTFGLSIILLDADEI